MLESILKYQFLQNALIASVLASILCGLIGVIVIEKKLTMMSSGVAHTAYGGVGLGYMLGFEPIYGAFLFALASAFGIGYFKRKGNIQSDISIALFWSFGMALGIVFVGFAPGYTPDMSTYLFGDILSVRRQDLIFMAIMTLITVFVVVALFEDWKAYLFDEEFASIIGIRTKFLEYLLLALIALAVVMLIRIAGIILVLALLTAPAATAGLLSNSLKFRMILSTVFGLFFCFVGLWLSYVFNISSGACIVILSIACYAVVYLFKRKI
ncbi:MAG: metal ABC transporter permease [Clostridia bacterium]